MNLKIDSEYFARADEEGREKMRLHLLGKHPSLRGSVIARSILSRPIEAYFVGEGRRYILLTAAHRAGDCLTTNLAFAFVDYLLSKFVTDDINGIDCKLLLSNYCFLVIPCVNPDGLELRMNGISETPLKERLLRMSDGDFSLWEANGRGVDLGRNYEAGYSEYKVAGEKVGISAGAELYCGEYPESEPETRGVANLVRTLAPTAVVSLKMSGKGILAYPRSARSQRCAGRIAAAMGREVGVDTAEEGHGSLTYYAASLGIPSFDISFFDSASDSDKDFGRIFFRIADAVATLPTFI